MEVWKANYPVKSYDITSVSCLNDVCPCKQVIQEYF